MATITLNRKTKQIKEAYLITGMLDNRRTQFELFTYCSEYFWNHYRGVFFATEDIATEIFQNSFIKFWENIENGKLYVENEVILGNNGKPITGSILTYFMGIAKLKYLEVSRQHSFYADPETEMGKLIHKNGIDNYEYTDILYNSDDNEMIDIIADIISRMSKRCNEILTKFYYEEKDLDTILLEIPTIENKNALKTKKYKCMENLRNSAHEIYNRYLK